jgi:hypothetical protein
MVQHDMNKTSEIFYLEVFLTEMLLASVRAD